MKCERAGQDEEQEEEILEDERLGLQDRCVGVRGFI